MNQWLHQMLFTLLGQPVTPLKLIYVAAILLLTFGIIILVRRLTRRFIFSKLQLAEFRVKLYQRTVSTILFFIGLTIATESFIPQAELIRHISEILNFRLFTLGDNPISLSALLTLLVFVIIFAIGSRLLRDMVLSRFLNYMRIDAGTQFTFERIVHYLIMVLGVVVAFQSIGVDLSGLAVIFGFLSVGIGFGLQNVTSNFVAGLILLFERPINVGDRVLIGDVEGDVNEIKIRATRIQTVDNISIIVLIPNLSPAT
ncbi:MAG: mechanosensitive ion channel [Calditrichia bacterium]